MPDRTVVQITDAAFWLNGIIDPNDAKDAKALIAFQDMLSSWSIDGLIVPYYITENFTLTIGQAVYTIGVTDDSPDFITTTGRPTKCISAWIRQSNNDHPIDVDMKEREYSAIVRKDTTQRPTKLYYDPQYPKGKIKFNYESDAAHDFHLVSEKPLTDVAAKTDTLSLPLGINEALVYNLALRLATARNNELSDDTRRIAIESLERLQTVNSLDKLQNPTSIDTALLIGVIR